jgi:MYXO-CTERM domain-containing protein
MLAACQLLAPVHAGAAPAPACSKGLGVGLVEVPTSTRDPRAQNYVIDHVAPGAHFSRRFQVCNGTAKPIAVQLYPGAAQIAEGGFRIIEGRAGNELSSWITIDPPQATLQPGQRLLARATFTVPKDAERGERYAVLLAELPPQRNATGVSISSRIGVRVYLDVGPGGAPKSDFVVDSLQAGRDTDGTGLVTAKVHNTGKRALDMTGSLTLKDGPGGVSGGPYPATVGTTLAPGQTEPVLVHIKGSVVSGPWTVRLSLRSGLLERRVEAGLTFPDAPGAEAPPVDVEQLAASSDQGLNLLPALVTVGLTVLALGGLVGWRRRRQ